MTKRARPKQHTRKVKTSKGKKKVLVNKGVRKRIKVKPFKRGKHKVQGYTRKMRKMGKKITYKTVGTFQLGHDELGNIRGSKIIIDKSKVKKTKRKREPSFTQKLGKIDQEYKEGKIEFGDWLDKRAEAIK